MRKRREKLLLITPDGDKHEIGFLSPCKDGFVLGTSEIEGVETSHLTVLDKGGEISAHITPQKTTEKRKSFSPITKKEITGRIKSVILKGMVHELTEAEMSENVLYVTQKSCDWFDSLKRAFYRKRILQKEIIHILDFPRLIKRLPVFINEFKQSPKSFLGLCKTSEMLEDRSKVLGLSNSKILIVRHRGRLYGVNLSSLFGFSFDPTLNREEISGPLAEIDKGLGIPQYIEEVQSKNFFQKLLSKSNSIHIEEN
jgi:hypothetical protein